MSAIKKAVKKVGKFVKKHWKKIVIAAAVVFTAGAAAGGMAALKGAFAAKGLLGGIGATMKAGTAAIGAVLKGGGIVGAKAAAGGSFAVSSGATAAAAAAQAAGAGTGIGIQGTGIGIGGAGAGAGAGTIALPGMAGAGGLAPAVTPTLMSTAATAAPTVAKTGFWSGLGGQALINGGIGAAQALIAGQDDDENDPKGFYGVDMQGKANLRPSELSFSDADITGGASSFRRPLMYDPPGGG